VFASQPLGVDRSGNALGPKSAANQFPWSLNPVVTLRVAEHGAERIVMKKIEFFWGPPGGGVVHGHF
jgi:hypothetical protein